MVSLRPVVEAPFELAHFWCPLPPRPWPDFFELSGSATDGDVALVLLQLATYNRGGNLGPLLAFEIAELESPVLPGGLEAVGDDHRISPSCCCGLEDWIDWRDASTNGTSLWMGHDPAPWLELRDGCFYLWSDAATPEQPAPRSLRISPLELDRQLTRVSEMLSSFLIPLRRVLIAFAPDHADTLVAAFRRTFVHGDTGAHERC